MSSVAVSADAPSPSVVAERRLRVLFLARYYYWWLTPGVGMLHLAKSPLGLRERGHDVRFVCERRPEQTFDDDGLDVRAFEAPSALQLESIYSPRFDRAPWARPALVRAAHVHYLARAWRTAIEACRDWRPDVVYCQTEQPVPVAVALRKQLGVPFVVHVYGGGAFSESDVKRPRWRAAHYLDVAYAYRANPSAMIVVDDGTRADAIARALGMPADKIHHWEIPVAAPSPRRGSHWRAQLGIPADAPVVISVARFTPIKRMDACLDVAAAALAAHPAAHAILTGDGPERANLEAARAALPDDVRARIHFTGSLERDALSNLLTETDVFLTLQEVSVSGTNLRDAMAHGLCVIAVRRPQDAAIASLLEDGVTGRLIDEPDLPGAGAALAALLRDPARARQMGAAALARAQRSFLSWDRRIQEEEALLHTVARGSR